MKEYGLWLSERHMREDAAVTFMAAGDLEAALQEYQEGNFWQMAMFIAGDCFRLPFKVAPELLCETTKLIYEEALGHEPQRQAILFQA